MKILVPVKRVLDHNVKVQLRADGLGVELAHQPMAMNPFDEVALEEALRLREAGAASAVWAVSCGRTDCQETLRQCLALGADRALWVHAEEALQPLAVAKLLKAVALRESPDLIVCGKQAIDDDAAQTGPMLAAMLGWPQATAITALALHDGQAWVTRAIEGGEEQLALHLPALVSAELHLNMPRYATLANIMKARRKEIEVLSAAELEVDCAPRLHTLAVAAPPTRAPGQALADGAALAAWLRQAGFVAKGAA